MSDLPDVLQEAEAYLYDFNTGEFLAEGLCNVIFTRQADPLRVKRSLFEGEFHPATAEGAEALRQHLLVGVSVGSPALQMHVDYERNTYVFTIKLGLQNNSFPFTGRAEPKLL